MTSVVPARKVMVALGKEDSQPSVRQGGEFGGCARFAREAINPD
jgi:hypothetical protein